ncbi:MAG: hypothetical protein K0R66_1299 [Gammaproteobacteria bacterium]|jgi:hypothetical protein|nr:hypothetical protein [Gammaproteobacteria bacterium]
MNKQQATELMHRIYENLLDPGYLAKISEIYHKDVVLEIGSKTAYYDDVINRARYRLEHFAEFGTMIEDVLVDGDKITVRIKQSGSLKSGKPSDTYHGVVIYQVSHAKVSKVWGVFSPDFNYLEKA